MPKRTARQEIERAFHVSFKLPEQAAQLLDAYRAEILTEAAEMIRTTASARLDEVGEDDIRPSDWERHGEWYDAADILIEAAGGAR
ncbi:hypothetical protein [Kitasatospora sp. A2-31]|uniref:hypothetical protein n=1 Tax=Kitasatospora sp. A2-31 TaxID=2916414 RepID=UPI001EE79A4E|nr:hypothetical protein [Kitasatospora sp. A2-31]MCG6493402.1 hypothetical protein [Kitasatospora sp. A2-31]